MMTWLEDWNYRILSRDDSWLGLRRLKPAPDEPYTSIVLLQVAAALGLATAAVAYGMVWAFLRLTPRLHLLDDPTTWLPRLTAWGGAVCQMLVQVGCMWLWNRRLARLHPAASRRGWRATP